MAWDGNPEQLVYDTFLHDCVLHAPPGFSLKLNYHRPTDHDVCQNPGMCYWGSILRDGDLVYRIGEYDGDSGCWHARWPD